MDPKVSLQQFAYYVEAEELQRLPDEPEILYRQAASVATDGFLAREQLQQILGQRVFDLMRAVETPMFQRLASVHVSG